MSAALRAFEGFGLEFEYMIVECETLAVKPIADVFLSDISQSPAPPHNPALSWSNELALHVVELKNPHPVADIPSLRHGLEIEIKRANRLLEPRGAILMPGAMHPWMNPRTDTRLWPHEPRQVYEAFQRVFNCYSHGWSNVQSVQLNLPFSGDEEFARLHAATRLILPLIPALAAASPFVEGRPARYSDYRMHVVWRHQHRIKESMGQVIPDTLRSRAEYEARVLTPMYAAIDAVDESGALRQEWLDVRAAVPRFSRSAIEIRATDIQECPLADLAIAQAIAATIRWLYNLGDHELAAQQALPTCVLAELMQSTIQSSGEALVMEPRYLKLLHLPATVLTASTIWKHLLRRAEPALDAASAQSLEVILNQGTLSRRILRAINSDLSRDRLTAVWRKLCQCLADDQLFITPSLS